MAAVTERRCLFCGHEHKWHSGAPQATKDRFKAEGHRVRWTSSGCSKPGCPGCRRWEA